ncbi:MAG: chemotaxis protein CheW [Paracoccaceae bacterium]
MAKKFDKISPKNISEAKFNQLVDALPSAAIATTKKLVPEPEQKETSVKIKRKKEKKKKLIEEKKSEPKNSESTDTEPIAVPIIKNKKPKNEQLVDTSEVFVYECTGVLFGIPVAYVTEITNEYGTISPLKGFLRSCVGTTEYRGRLLPIFQSHESYLKTSEVKEDANINLEKTPTAIITINYNGIMFALTMETHVGIVSVNPASNQKTEVTVEEEDKNDLLKDIVWYGDQNLFIFSPEKISNLVFLELKNQIAIASDAEKNEINVEEETVADLRQNYMLAKIKNSTIAIEITKVLEVIEGSEVTSLYKVADFIRGLISLRGQVLSCIDLSRHLGHELTVIDERNKFIVIDVSGVNFALCIDRVLGIQSIQQSTFQDSTKVFQNEIPNYFPNFREKDGEVTLIFKPDLFLKSTELQEYQKN